MGQISSRLRLFSTALKSAREERPARPKTAASARKEANVRRDRPNPGSRMAASCVPMAVPTISCRRVLEGFVPVCTLRLFATGPCEKMLIDGGTAHEQMAGIFPGAISQHPVASCSAGAGNDASGIPQGISHLMPLEQPLPTIRRSSVGRHLPEQVHEPGKGTPGSSRKHVRGRRPG